MTTPTSSPHSEAHLLWQQVLALTHRYPTLAARIRPAWWERPAERELLRALCAWRDALDLILPSAGKELDHARAEFEFHDKLTRACDLLASTATRGIFDPQAEQASFQTHLDELADHCANDEQGSA